MADALTLPGAVVALVLCVAAVAKLRSPRPAAQAIGVGPALIRALAVAELALGLWALVKPSAVTGALMAALYAGFAAVTMTLARRGAACGCFGSDSVTASPLQSLVSLCLACVAAAAALAGVHGIGWVLALPTSTVVVLVLGTMAAVYAVVLAYRELPVLWRAWSPAR